MINKFKYIQMQRKIADFNKLCAFTLAEVLITLAIIGVVAALTIPTVVRNYQERQTVTQLKKFYSTISQAYQIMQVNEGAPETWNWGSDGDGVSADIILQKMVPYLKIIKNCHNTSTGCLYNGAYKSLNPSINWANANNNGSARAVLADGSAIFLYTYGGHCATSRGISKALKNSVCSSLAVDLNGTKPPNRLGVDTFHFYITKYGIIPFGTKDNTRYCIKSSSPLSCTDYSSCLLSLSNTAKTNGLACTAWVIQKGNMDYLKRDIRDEW